MAKSLFKVAYVERGMEALWRDFWMEKEPSNQARKAHEDGHLGRVELNRAGFAGGHWM